MEICNSSIREAETGLQEVEGESVLHSEYQAIQGSTGRRDLSHTKHGSVRMQSKHLGGWEHAESGIQSQPELYSKFEVRLSYMRPYINKLHGI